MLFFILITICIILLSSYYLRKYIYNKGYKSIDGTCQIKEVVRKEEYQRVLIRYKGYQYYLYPSLDYDLKVGDYYYLKGKVENPLGEHYEHGFNYAFFLENKGIQGIIKENSFYFLKKGFCLNTINFFIEQYFVNNYSTDVSAFLCSLIIGTNTGLNEEITDNIKGIGISHLFVVSGLHVGIIVSIVDKGLSFMKITNRKKFSVICLFLVGYLVITRFLVSVIRVSLSYVLKKLHITDLTSLDIMVINIILVLLINPCYIYTYSFILTYLIATGIIILNPMLRKNKGFLGNIKSMVIISIISIVITIPIISLIEPKINFLSIIYNLFYIPVMSYFLLPFMILTAFLPFLNNLASLIIRYFNLLTSLLNEISFGSLIIPSMNVFTCLIYYLLVGFLLIMIEKKKYYYLLIYPVLLFLLINVIYTNSYNQVHFMDLKEGEATLIEKAHNQGNILIDTGIEDQNEILTYLYKRGIKRLDLIIISHGDDDHNGCLDSLIKNIKVKKVIISSYDQISKEILKQNNFNEYEEVKRGDNFVCCDIRFDVLWPYTNMGDNNNNSLVFMMDYLHLKWLFVGDLEEKGEIRLSKLEGKINCDIYKIGHHGSNTSTKKAWLANINFNIGICMSGYGNIFSFPNQYVIERLKDYNIFYTKEHQTIIIRKKLFSQKVEVII